MDAVDELDALRRLSPAKVVISNGKVIAETHPSCTSIQINEEREVVDYKK